MGLFCSVVIIKFFDKAAPAQEVRALQVTGARKLRVTRDDTFLILDYFGEMEFSIKRIAYNLKDVKEYACEGVLKNELL